MASDREKPFAAATNVWLNMSTMVLHNQAFLLRYWADNIDRFAQKYGKDAEALESAVEQGSKRAA
jgi:hypothetical protein